MTEKHPSDGDKDSSGDKNVIALRGTSTFDALRLIAGYLKQIGWYAELEQEDTYRPRLMSVTSEHSAIRFLLSREPQAAMWDVIREEGSVRIETRFRQISSVSKRSVSAARDIIFLLPFLALPLIALAVPATEQLFDLPNTRAAMLRVAWVLLMLSFLLLWVHFTRFDEWDITVGFYAYVYESTGKKPLILRQLVASFSQPFFLFKVFNILAVLINGVAVVFVSAFSATQSPAIWGIAMFFVPTAVGTIAVIPLLKSELSDKWIAQLASITIGSYLTYYGLIPLMVGGLLEAGFDAASVRVLGVLIVSIVFLVFLIISLYIPTEVLKRRQLRAFASVKIDRDLQAFTPNYAVFSLWVLCALSNLFAIYFSCAALEYLLLQKNTVFRLPFVSALTAAYGFSGTLAYSVPMLLIPMVFASKRLRETVTTWQAARSTQVPHALQFNIAEIAEVVGIRGPRVIILERGLMAAHAWRLPLLGNVLTLTSTALELLSVDELKAVIAHELWHLKRHSFLFSALESLSRWSLLGRGFLTVLVESRTIEYQADEFSVGYLSSVGIPKEALISALDKFTVHNVLLQYLAPSTSALSFTPPALSNLVGGTRLSLRARLAMLYHLYFGDLILSYVHPTAEERIARIETLA